MKNINVAIADDHKYVRAIVCDILLKYGYSVVLQAANGEDLLNSIPGLEQLPDICIMDINMPVMDGFIATREMKKRWPHVKILGYSINYEKAIIEEMLNSGADAFLNKGELPEKLDEMIKSLLN
ncbi:MULTISPECIES: response regulator [Mucilaginibacter]|uniref:Response regulator transcription factor n=2 Tax=Mucilaginibacter TaxID=423349 RepID=A0A5B8USJ7_9SPHI|nr:MULTISPECIES: response regulator transcription factor [Mucilaginibacter]MBE9668117.1 response regulator transcription factor [Mucilaginibacter boryungensis]QEC61949.1 response regulator transcription factor [Mucilaginibacter ginsenosidivorans]